MLHILTLISFIIFKGKVVNHCVHVARLSYNLTSGYNDMEMGRNTLSTATQLSFKPDSSYIYGHVWLQIKSRSVKA
jgi:hypothetical protein